MKPREGSEMEVGGIGKGRRTSTGLPPKVSKASGGEEQSLWGSRESAVPPASGPTAPLPSPLSGRQSWLGSRGASPEGHRAEPHPPPCRSPDAWAEELHSYTHPKGLSGAHPPHLSGDRSLQEWGEVRARGLSGEEGPALASGHGEHCGAKKPEGSA